MSPDTVEFNLSDVFSTVAQAVPERECIVTGHRRFTYREINDRSTRLASYLHSLGLGTRTERNDLANHESGQDHIGLYLFNGNEYIEAMIGCYRSRVAPFNVNYRYVKDELLYLLRDAGTRGLIYHATFAPTIEAILDELPEVDVLIQVADESGNDLIPGAFDYEEILASQDPVAPQVETSPDDLYILYTGGTTGMPKGVLWRQHDIFMAAMGGRRIGTWEEVGSYEAIAQGAINGSAMKSMPLPPLMHGAAQWVSFISMSAGGTIVMPSNTRNLDPVDVLATIEREKVNIVALVGDAMARPVIEELENQSASGRSYDLSSLLAVGNGGAPLNASLKERLLAVIPNLIVSDSVGSSETGAQASHVSTKGSVQTGNFVPGPGAVVTNEAMDELLEPGSQEIGWLGQGGWVPLGYLGDPEKTMRTFPEIQGARYSIPGDRARHLEGGIIELLGRDSATINSGGEKIFAEEVELSIASHPAVADVIVVGRSSDKWGQEVVALVKLGEGRGATVQELVEHAANSIARYKLPKSVQFMDEIRRSPAGKADYRWAKQQVERA
ncbi:MAG TPA: acyl-CoA synthetase [Acidimicrobiales bacterium]|nr:acyl-CoA synthetase [Acidimicrobiales bacterium]